VISTWESLMVIFFVRNLNILILYKSKVNGSVEVGDYSH
jgi:hypothetical protein